MGELTEQEKLERRRQKRQQRILQSGESRLGKITGTAFRKSLERWFVDWHLTCCL